MRLGLFGGSFDPVHNGHLAAAAEAADALELDELRFIPARAQPFKAGRHDAGAADRLAMLELAVAADPRFVVDGRELRRPGPSYTVDTIREIRAERPGDELFLLVGADTARELPAWRESDVIGRPATIVTLTRPGVPMPEYPSIERAIEFPGVDVSATMIRSCVRDGRPVNDYVPQAVARYIADRGLYVEGD